MPPAKRPSPKKSTPSSAPKRTTKTVTRSRSGKPVDKKAVAAEVKKGRTRAERYKNDPEAANALLEEAMKKGGKKGGKKGPLAEVWDSLQTLIRMVRAYFNGSYEEVPWETIALAIVAVAYFVLPFDLIPDFIPVAGYFDDAAVIAAVIKSIDSDLDQFALWEQAQKRTANRRKPVARSSSGTKKSGPAKASSGSDGKAKAKAATKTTAGKKPART